MDGHGWYPQTILKELFFSVGFEEEEIGWFLNHLKKASEMDRSLLTANTEVRLESTSWRQ